METLETLHSLLRWLVLVALVAGAGFAILRWRQKAEWTPEKAKTIAMTMIAYDVQVLIGLILWIGGRTPRADHPYIMLLALAVGHIAIARARKTEGERGYFVAGFGLVLVLVLTLAGIPWGA